MTQLASSPVSMRLARRLPGQYRLSVPMDRRVPGSELPYEDGIPLDSDWHYHAMTLLTDIMDYYRKDRHDLYVAANMFVYFDPDQVKTRNFRGPDFFVIKGVKDHAPRKSWVIWEEDYLTPDFVIELASSSTASFDRKGKKDIYEQILKTPEYVIYNPETEKLSAWRLSGGRYTPIKADARGWVWSNELGLWVGVAEHDFSKFRAKTPRFFDRTGKLVPSAAEAEAENRRNAEKRAIRAEERAVNAEAEIARLKALLADKE